MLDFVLLVFQIEHRRVPRYSGGPLSPIGSKTIDSSGG
jgi:hypothetical protein